jgi:hypothetical protein
MYKFEKKLIEVLEAAGVTSEERATITVAEVQRRLNELTCQKLHLQFARPTLVPDGNEDADIDEAMGGWGDANDPAARRAVLNETFDRR